jgi:two-component system sensor histidine kinase VicK
MLLDPKLPEEKRRTFAEIIAREGRRLERLVQDFLTLSRIEAGRFELELSKVDVRAVAEDIVRLESEHQKNHTLENRLPESFPEIVADRERLKRVLYNLVSNAIKYSPDGGKVTITGRARDSEVDISVTDEGIGIREQDLDRLFKRFERVNREATPNVSGTGLGLSICASIVGKHGGRIAVESEYGRGSTFTVTLPTSGPSPEPAG